MRHLEVKLIYANTLLCSLAGLLIAGCLACCTQQSDSKEKNIQKTIVNSSTQSWDFSQAYEPYSVMPCKGIQNSLQCANAIEQEQIKKYAGSVSREGPVLKLLLQDGRVLEIGDTDPQKNPDAGKRYNFFDFLAPIGYYLLHGQFYEGSDFTLVNKKTGKSFLIASLPILSSDNRRFITVSICDAFCDVGIGIWRVTDSEIVREYILKPSEYWASGAAKWLDMETIELLFEIRNRSGQGFVKATRLLKFHENEWRIAEPQN